ncbi:unnamed protein product [Adineta steineri]|uniref:Microbial-type PARG catalytic domain-containing protein n=1 Tax=Adineta steineri TaxID=433720 RepID=A0A815FGW2_9BILA|nr:unnamed protein product [Adineta steineri]CAF1586718.1 unnamed protein product [Adineta steineri]
MGVCSTKMSNHYEYPPKRDESPMYVPFESLTKSVVHSVIKVVTSYRSLNEDYSERTLYNFLLAIKEKLEKIESDISTNEKKFDDHIIQHAGQVREWLMDRNNKPLDWKNLEKHYEKKINERERYWELKEHPQHLLLKRSRNYMSKSRKDGFKPEELKVYWNIEQLENLCPKEGVQESVEPPHDPSDIDAIKNLREFPVSTRKHRGAIKYVNKGIERAVFYVPEQAQIILLNFANEQSPGGGYLRGARAQEEVILYNSDGYRSLLDLKYGRMQDGYAIPEFGLAYVRDICFFDASDEQKHRKADMLVSACYCVGYDQLYDNPKTDGELKQNTLSKFRAFMAAAVANTIGDGKNTYLLLGPIGTGAFRNEVDDIAKVFHEVLNMKIMNSEGPVRFAFENIWFVSTDKWKNDEFNKLIHEDELDNTKDN